MGDIYEGIYEKRVVALKRLRIYLMYSGTPKAMLKKVGDRRSSWGFADVAGALQEFYDEALIWRTLSHPHILPIFGLTEEVFEYTPCMVMPWLEHGNIIEYITVQKRKGQLRGADYVTRVERWVRSVFNQVAYARISSIAYRSIKSPWVLHTYTTKRSFTALCVA